MDSISDKIHKYLPEKTVSYRAKYFIRRTKIFEDRLEITNDGLGSFSQYSKKFTIPFDDIYCVLEEDGNIVIECKTFEHVELRKSYTVDEMRNLKTKEQSENILDFNELFDL